MTTIITFQESNYTDSGFLYRCPGNHFEDFSNEYVPLAEYEALQAERDALAQRLKIAEEVESHLGDKLQDARQFQANQREVNAMLARDCKKAEAGNKRLREALENMLYIFDNGYDKADSLGRMRCDEARQVLGDD